MEGISSKPKEAGGDEDGVASAQIQLWETMSGFINSAVLWCMIQMRLPSIIHAHGEPITLDRLAAAVLPNYLNGNCHKQRDGLHRILRYLAHMNLLRIVRGEEENGQEEYKYGLTPASKLLVNGQENSHEALFSFILKYESVHFIQEISNTSNMERVAENQEDEEYKWNLLDEDAELNREFMESMVQHTSAVAKEFVRSVEKWGFLDHGVETLVDVGGNNGQMAAAIAEAFPHVKCSVLEVAHVTEAITEPPPMVNIITGDMFESVPKSDVVFMKSVLHGWTDEDCIKILKKCKEAIPREEGKVILVEIVLDTSASDGLVEARLFMEMLMLLAGGKERTREEWDKLITSAGFSRYHIWSMKAKESVILLYP